MKLYYQSFLKMSSPASEYDNETNASIVKDGNTWYNQAQTGGMPMTVILIIIAAAIILCFGGYRLVFGGKTQCRNCGAYMAKKAKSCPNCGYRLREDYDNPHIH